MLEQDGINGKDNVLGVEPIDPFKKILTLMPSYMATSKTEFMTLEQIAQNNNLYDDKALTKVIKD